MLFIPTFEDVCHSLIDNFFKVLLYHFQSFLFKTFLFSLRFILLAFGVSKCLNDLLGRIAIQVHCRVIIGKLAVPVVGSCHSFTLISIFLFNPESSLSKASGSDFSNCSSVCLRKCALRSVWSKCRIISSASCGSTESVYLPSAASFLNALLTKCSP